MVKPTRTEHRSPWLWVPSLYYAEGLPYVIVMTVSVIMYKKLGISNTDIALYTSWLYLPWVIKPLWSPVVDLFKTKREWIVFTQLIIGGGLASVAVTLPSPHFFKITLLIFWLIAFNSATHDIAADGFYMLGLTQHQQAWFVGVRSTFYRFAMLTGQGLLVILAGLVESHSGLEAVPIKVHTTEQRQIHYVMDDTVLHQANNDGKQRLLHAPDEVFISIRPLEASQYDSLMEVYHPSEQFSQKRHPTLGQKFVSNIGAVYFWLARQPGPGEEIIVQLGRKSGDKSFSLLEGSRLVFNEKNWNRPVPAIIQPDAKIGSKSSALFIASAGNIRLSWVISIACLAVLFVFFFIYHRFILPYPPADRPRAPEKIHIFLREFGNTFVLFFRKKKIGVILFFLLFYRFGEAQLVKLAAPFLLDSQQVGGLGLTTGQVGFVYGTVGLLSLTIGGLAGGFLAARDGLKKWLWPMALAIQLPDSVYVYLAHFQPENFAVVNACIAIEQFGYGFGFTAYMLYMIHISEGEFKTAHYAIATGFMALGMMLPGMISGWIQELVGYRDFFMWVLFSTLPGLIVLFFLPLDDKFGKKSD
ncbi:MFS transporter [candidate division KSB1 bacterium RBG_16_48_16]|nr:MAG: MFS transporter [candidate division KSB1 bacterium RBG_16_48_16]